MTEPLVLALDGLTGAALGAFFFGGLWWTVRRGLRSPSPVRWFLLSALVRTLVVVGVIYLLCGARWERLLACLTGFTLARLVALRIGARGAADGTPSPLSTGRHAP